MSVCVATLSITMNNVTFNKLRTIHAVDSLYSGQNGAMPLIVKECGVLI